MSRNARSATWPHWNRPPTSLAPRPTAAEALEDLTDSAIDPVLTVARNCIPPLMQIEVQQIGRAPRRRRAEHGSFTPPDSPYLLHLVTPAVKEPFRLIAAATRDAIDALGDAITGAGYFNFLRGDEQARVPAAFTEDVLARLRDVKNRYDPNNLFSLNPNIAPGAHS